MRRLPLVIALALALVAVLLVPAGGAYARTTGARDHSSARTASNAWLRFARAGLRTLPAARKRLDALSASISSDCPNVLAFMNATPPDQLDWEVVNNLA